MLNYVVGRAVRSPSGWSGVSSARARVAAGGRPIGRKASSSTSPTTPPAAGAAPSDGGGGSRGRGAYKAFFFAGTGFAAGAAFAHLRPDKARSGYATLCDSVVMPLLRMLDAEEAHTIAVKAASLGLAPKDWTMDDPILASHVMGLRFPNPIGLAAGFDKHGEAVDGLMDTGFGFVEVGSVTPNPQEGNPKPRMFRLEEDEGVINRCGFNSDGLRVVQQRLKKRQASAMNGRAGLLGVNVGKNKLSEDSSADFCKGIRTLGCYADYLVVNVSSPNTPGLRDLQGVKAIRAVILAAMDARDQVCESTGNPMPLPLLVKIAPDLTEREKRDIANVVLSTKVDGLIVSNTTVSRPSYLRSESKGEAGGLSGKPLTKMSTETIRDMYRLTKGKVPLIGVGGVGTGQEAYDKIRAGASLVQVYSLLVYKGPGAVPGIKAELADLLKTDGFTSVAEAVGSDHRPPRKASRK
ncbi:dihydroorotate dehydrogenase [Ectocarpus siliculosus]|uniref:Dihydroorotate dehydrogenase (quinone), mitochondrial n=1 Tax=Ectocarpus siliculosus TaxID=2880 RepID=D8LB11_ECTSI|nr:dihydroorotate dehydrogenase [Ectocarpus siliculosus]|eukprot:CBN76520.1 dihydroorotate dehydrogenase [Ectocarpus siliculosus]